MSSFLNKFRPSKGTEADAPQAPTGAAEDLEIQAAPQTTTTVNEKGEQVEVGPADDNAADLKEDKELPDLDAQFGVQKVEAITLSWNKKSLAGLLVM